MNREISTSKRQLSMSLFDRLANAQLVVALTGAGISAESGVPTFRSNDGLWAQFKPEELASLDAFMANPQLVWAWYQARRHVTLACKPNPGHHALAAMEKLTPKVSVITQNVDGLHHAAGSTEVIELHGNIARNYCQSCGKRYDGQEMLAGDEVRRCACGGLIRPDVVWFGEMLPDDAIRLAQRRAMDANVFFVIGTSGVVYPAAGLPVAAREHGAYIVEINPEETPLTRFAHEVIRKPGSQALREVVAGMSATSTS